MNERPAADLVPQGDLSVVLFGALVGIVEVAVVCLAVYGLIQRSRLGHCPLQGGIVQAGQLHFDNQADTGPLGTVGVGNSSRTATAILALFFLCEPSRLGRRPSAYNAAYEEAPSGQDHSHGVLPYWKATDEDGSSVMHGGLSSSPRSQLGSSQCVATSPRYSLPRRIR